jgi:nucleoside-diphosphate-sugar epimerase
LSDATHAALRPPVRHAIVTGAAGFLGSALVARLSATGVTVTGLDRRAPARAASGTRHVIVDLQDAAQLARVLRDARGTQDATCVFHLAAQPHVGACKADPRAAFAANVAATAHLLEAARDVGIRNVVYPSTALVYGRPHTTPIDEAHPTQASSIYAATKLAAEQLLAGYAADFGFTCSVARLGNVYGTGGHSDSIAAIVLAQAKRGGPIRVRSTSPVRDFVHRDDVCAGLLALARSPGGFGVYNLASGRATSVGELAYAACLAAGIPANVVASAPESAAPNDVLSLSIARIEHTFAWRPALTLEAGVAAALAELEPLA